MNTLKDVDILQLLEPIFRRKELVTAIFLVVSILGVYLAANLPNVYRSSTLILITPQGLPQNYVSSTIATQSVEQRMRTIAEQILSRTSLDNIVREFNLFPTVGSKNDNEGRIIALRKSINLAISRNETFSVSFESGDPEQAMRVLSRIAELFISESVKVRERQAVGTTLFINNESERLRKELEEQEQQVNLYKSSYRNDLPEQLDANLRTVEQLRREMDSATFRLTALEERKSSLDKQLAGVAIVSISDGQTVTVQGIGTVDDRKSELARLLRTYSEKHPDVIRLKKEIEQMVLEASTQPSDTKISASSKQRTSTNPMGKVLISQIDDISAEIASLKEKNRTLQTEIASYQSRVNNTPMRAVELAKITRNYDITLKKFQELLAKEFDSRLSENMEKTQKGEQFRIVDSPTRPVNPISPNRPMIILISLLVGLGGGCGLAFVLDILKPSFRKAEDFDGYSSLPVLAVLSSFPTRGAVLGQRRLGALTVAYSAVVLALGLTFIRLFASSLPLR